MQHPTSFQSFLVYRDGHLCSTFSLPLGQLWSYQAPAQTFPRSYPPSTQLKFKIVYGLVVSSFAHQCPTASFHVSVKDPRMHLIFNNSHSSSSSSPTFMAYCNSASHTEGLGTACSLVLSIEQNVSVWHFDIYFETQILQLQRLTHLRTGLFNHLVT
jgi:hypothetical protein